MSKPRLIPQSYTLSLEDLAQGGAMGMALYTGRLRATVVSKRSGADISIHAECRRKVKGRWKACDFEDAERIFLSVPQVGARNIEVGCVHLEGTWRGKIMPPFDEQFDEARLWAARFVLDAACGRRALDTEAAEILQGTHCFACGQELDDDQSIKRGFGRDCFEQLTKPRVERVAVEREAEEKERLSKEEVDRIRKEVAEKAYEEEFEFAGNGSAPSTEGLIEIPPNTDPWTALREAS